MVTDYDCWHPGHAAVTVEQVIAVLNQNAQNAAQVVRRAVAAMPKRRACGCGSALQHAIMTAAEKIPLETREQLQLLIDKYLPRPHVAGSGRKADA